MKTPQSEYRAICYGRDGEPKVLWPTSSAEDTPEALSIRLDHQVDAGDATGGHLETWVRGIGWIVEE